MRNRVKARALRTVAMLFGLSLLLTACDVATVQEYLSDIMGGMPAAPAGDAADDAADEGSEATDAADEGSEATDAADEVSDDGSGPSEGGDDGDEAASEGDDDSAEAARERCINRNEHVANLRSPERIRKRARDRDRRGEQRERADDDASQEQDDEADDAPAGSDSDADSEAPAEPRDEPAPSPEPSGGSGGGSGGGGGAASDLSSVEQQVFDLLMTERERAGLEPLELDSSLTAGARGWSQRMATENFFSHDTSGNFAENIAYGYPTAAAVHDGWMDSDGHRRNRMNPGYSSYGIGVHKQGNTLYYTERFR